MPSAVEGVSSASTRERFLGGGLAGAGFGGRLGGVRGEGDVGAAFHHRVHQAHVFAHVRGHDQVAPVAPLGPVGGFEAGERIEGVGIKDHGTLVALEEFEDEPPDGRRGAQPRPDGQRFVLLGEMEQVLDPRRSPRKGGGIRADGEDGGDDLFGRRDADEPGAGAQRRQRHECRGADHRVRTGDDEHFPVIALVSIRFPRGERGQGQGFHVD